VPINGTVVGAKDRIDISPVMAQFGSFSIKPDRRRDVLLAEIAAAPF
jgi:hypothetical protein